MFQFNNAVSVNIAESENKSNSKCISQVLVFYNTFYWLLTKIFETEFLEKNNTTGTDSSILHFD